MSVIKSCCSAIRSARLAMFRLVAMSLPLSLIFDVDCVSAGFLVGRCDAVHDQLVVRGFVHFLEVGCFVGSFTFGTIESKQFFSHS